MAFLLPHLFETLPVVWANGTRDGSSLKNDAATLAWLISNDFYRISRAYTIIAACDVHGQELLDKLKKHFGKDHPDTKKVTGEGTGYYCRCISDYRIINVPWHIFIQLRVAR